MSAPLSSQIPSPHVFQHSLPIPFPPIAPPPPTPVQPPKVVPASPREFGFGILSALCNTEVVDRVVAECDRQEQRCRLLPSRLMVYAILFMCLKPNLSYVLLMHHLAEVIPSPNSWPVPNRSSFARARTRLGWEVMERLFRTLARPLAEPQAACCFWRGQRVMAIDGTTIELADNPELDKAFGGQKDKKGRLQGAPMLRAVSLAECGTRAMIDVELAPYDKGESKLAGRLIRSIRPGMLVLCDRNYSSVKLWRQFLDAGADLVWRAKSTIANRIIRHLPDGTYLSIFGSGQQRTTLRVIEYVVEGSDEVYRLITNLLDPTTAPAEELARLYTERWEIETSYKELKTHQIQALPLRSLTEDGVRQEFWAHCVLYNINRQLVYQAAMAIAQRDPDRISFTLAKDAVDRSAERGIGLKVSRLRAAVQQAVGELTMGRALVSRRPRSCPRIVRRKGHKYPSRACHNGPLSTRKSRWPDIFPVAPKSA